MTELHIYPTTIFDLAWAPDGAATQEQRSKMEKCVEGFADALEIAVANSTVVGRWWWHFADLPKEMKAVAAGLVSRIVLGGDPSQMLPSERQILSQCRIVVPDYRPNRITASPEQLLFEA